MSVDIGGNIDQEVERDTDADRGVLIGIDRNQSAKIESESEAEAHKDENEIIGHEVQIDQDQAHVSKIEEGSPDIALEEVGLLVVWMKMAEEIEVEDEIMIGDVENV